MNIIVSACLLGVNSKYNGGNNFSERVAALMKHHNLIQVCPEQLGGMTTPRYPSEIVPETDRVKNNQGMDVTTNFIKGAEEALKLALLYDCKYAILKSNSPSCGYGSVYDGTFSGKLIDGNGIFAQMLVDNGIKVYTENDEFVI